MVFLLFFLTHAFAGGISPETVLIGPDVLSAKTVSVEIKKAAKATVVVFLSARCPCSASHEKVIGKLYQEFSPKGFQFIGVHSNVNEEEAITKSHFSGSALGFPIIEDKKAKLADEFSALKTPHVFIVSPAGEILFSGGVDDSKTGETLNLNRRYLASALEAVSNGKEPDLKEVKTLGCVIERP